ncbi:hypothetical protein ACWGCW_00480 [Streptomyces sp. NPDC054933]
MAASHARVAFRMAALSAALTLAGIGLLYAGHRLTQTTPQEG